MTGTAEALDRHRPGWVSVLAALIRLPLTAWFRARVLGADRLPAGPAVLAGNHSGGTGPGDAVFWATVAPTLDVPLYVVAHRGFFRLAPLAWLLGRFGVIPGSPELVGAALARGAKVLVYPGGDHDSLRPFADRARVHLGGRKGFLRVAHQAGVPVVPVATRGSHGQLLVLARPGYPRRILGLHGVPVALALPWGLLVGPMILLPILPFPTGITVTVLPARATTGDLDADYRAVVADLEGALTR